MILFLDTEFTDLGPEMELLSMALVSEDSAHELYLERNDVHPDKCSTFVRHAVLPWMGKDPAVSGDEHWCRLMLGRFISGLPEVCTIACDHPVDFDWLRWLLGEDTPWPQNLEETRIHLELITAPAEFAAAVARYHEAPGRPWHHALWDARALRAAWLDRC